MSVKEPIKSQYRASLEMLRQAILKCPDWLWEAPEYKNQFWHIAYHAIFYAHLYLHPSEADFIPWEKHQDKYRSLESPPKGEEVQDPYRKEEILAYLQFCLEHVEEMVEVLDLEGESGFYWLPFNKLELQFYNIRHIMQHTGELCERLGSTGEVEVDWVGIRPKVL